MLERLKDWLLMVLLFLLPWQTRWIYKVGELDGRYFEYATLSLYATEILLWAAVTLSLVQIINKKDWWVQIKQKFTKKKRQTIIIAIVISLLALRAMQGVGEIAFQQLVFMLGAMCLGLMLVISRMSFKNMSLAFWFGAAGQGALALGQFMSQQITANKWLGIAYQSGKELGTSVIEFGDERWLRAYGAFGSPNTLGIYLAIAWIVGFLVYEKSSAKTRIAITLGQLCILIGLILTFSRGAWIAALIGCVLWVARLIKQKEWGVIIKNAIYSCAVIGVLVVLLWPLFLNRVQSTGRLEERSTRERISQYDEARALFISKPFLGVGLRNYTFALKASNPQMRVADTHPVHNAYIMILIELGLLGSALLIWWGSRLPYKAMFRSSLPIIGVLVVAAFFDHSLWTLYPGLLILGVAFGLSSKIHRDFTSIPMM